MSRTICVFALLTLLSMPVQAQDSSFKKPAKDSNLQVEIQEAAATLRAATKDAERAAAEAKLNGLLNRDYDARLKVHEQQLNKLETRLKQMREGLQRKRSAKADMVKLRVQNLLANAEGLGWPNPDGAMGFVQLTPRTTVLNLPASHKHDDVLAMKHEHAATDLPLDKHDKAIDAALKKHSEGWNKLRDQVPVTVDQIEAVRDATWKLIPPMDELSPRQIWKLMQAGLCQDGAHRKKAESRLRQLVHDRSVNGALANFTLLQLALERSHGDHDDKQDEAEQIRKDYLAAVLSHPARGEMIQADSQLEVFTTLRRTKLAHVVKNFGNELLTLLLPVAEGKQLARISELTDCLVVTRIVYGESRPELIGQIHKSLLKVARNQLDRIDETYSDATDRDIYRTHLKSQIAYLQQVGADGSLIGTVARPLKFRWTSSDSIHQWPDLQGKASVLYFSTATCAPCVKSLPKLRALHKTVGKSVHFVGLAESEGFVALKRGVIKCEEDFDKECKLLEEYQREENITWPIAVIDGTVFDQSYGVRSVPHIVVLDAEGAIRDMFNPANESLETMVERIKSVTAANIFAEPVRTESP